jgi:hypothetical protein
VTKQGGGTRKITLLLTASIRPNQLIAGLTAPDPLAREAEYLAALDFFLRGAPSVSTIVFADNSRAPLERLRRTAENTNAGNKRLEFLQVGGNDFPGSLGKGFGEAGLIDRAMATSAHLQDSTLVAKVTGRQWILNFDRIVRRVPPGTRFLCDLHDHGLFQRFGIPAAGRFCDTRFFIFEPEFFSRHFRYLYKGHSALDGEYIIEDSYYRQIKFLQAANTVGMHTRLPIEPRFRGRAGHWHKDYGSLRQRAKQSLRALLRVLLPRVPF